MMTLRQFASGLESIPAATSWYLADMGEALGKQELFTRQSPQRLKVLREHALIESAVSSNRIEGVRVDQKRVGTLVFGKPHLRNRNEEEIQGYRNALKRIHENPGHLPISEKTIKELHAMCRGDVWDAGISLLEMETAEFHVSSGSCRLTSWVTTSDATSVSKESSNKMTIATTKHWSRVHTDGMRGGTIRGLTLITSCSS